MRTLNLGILAHVDAGKTSLSERLLYYVGVIEKMGSVDHGDTQTDSLAMEQKRGITIKFAVVSFAVKGIVVNLIDTPGHPDFIAEVERVLSVLDGVILVVSAVEGVQPQTRILMRALRRLCIPTVIFVNKIDRKGACFDRTLQGVAEKLTSDYISMGSIRLEGERDAKFCPFGADDPEFKTKLVDLLSKHDESVLAAYLEDQGRITGGELREMLAAQAWRALAHPVYFGSAITGAGVKELIDGFTEMLPAKESDREGPLSGVVLKIERGATGQKIPIVRVFTGELLARQRLMIRGNEQKVTSIHVFESGSTSQSESLPAGRIGRVSGLADVKVGDAIGEPRESVVGSQFGPPTLETGIYASDPNEKGLMLIALSQLTEQDPLINLRQDDIREEVFVSLYGEVQKEVIRDTLAIDYGIEVAFRETTTICVERVVGRGSALEILRKEPNPFLATIGLRVEPAELGSGVRLELGAARGSIPGAFERAIEETVFKTLEQGIHGWNVTDCLVTMTKSGYLARQSAAHGTFNKNFSSTARDFRNLTPLVLMTALKEAGTEVYEPIHQFRLEFPAKIVGSILSVMGRFHATPGTPAVQDAICVLEGKIPAARVHELQKQLPSLTRGEGTLESAFDSYQPVSGKIPTRRRTDLNPLNRKEYLVRVTRGGK